MGVYVPPAPQASQRAAFGKVVARKKHKFSLHT